MKLIFSVLVMLGFISTAKAQVGELPHYFNFDGYLLDASSNPITGPVSVSFQIYNPLANCLVFEENHASITPGADGSFSVKVGTGTRASASVDGGLAWKTIFQNNLQLRATSSPNCTSGYTPSVQDARKLRVTVAGTTLTPDYTISSVPTAVVAETLQGKTPSDFVSAVPYIFPNTSGVNGQVMTTDGVGNLSWSTPGGGGGLTSLNGLTGSAQTFVTGTSSLTPSWNSAGNIHTLNIPMASTAGVSAGLISKTDYDIFNNKMSNVSGVVDSTLRYDGTNWVSNSNVTVDGAGYLSLVQTPVSGAHAVTKNYVDASVATLLNTTGGSMTGVLNSTNRFVSSFTGSSTAPTFSVNSGNGIFSPGGNDLAVATLSVERVRFASSGNVGIGTTSPTATLDVNGQIKATNVAVTGGNAPGSACAVGGLIGYHLGTQSHVFCDGTTWNKAGGATVPGSGTGGFADFTYEPTVVMTSPASSISISGMENGGEYKLILQSATSQTYTFSGGGCSTWKYRPANGATTAAYDTIYKIQRVGSVCYVDWATGY